MLRFKQTHHWLRHMLRLKESTNPHHL
jgi:hypothetical protein